MEDDRSFSLPTEDVLPVPSSFGGDPDLWQSASTSSWLSTMDSAAMFSTPAFNMEMAISPSNTTMGVHGTATNSQASHQYTVPSGEPFSSFVNPPAVRFNVTENGQSRSLQSTQTSQQINPAPIAGHSSEVIVHLDPSPSVPPQPLSDPRAVYIIHGNRTTSFEMAKAIWKDGDPKGWRMFCLLGCYRYLGFDVVPEGTLCESCCKSPWPIRTY